MDDAENKTNKAKSWAAALSAAIITANASCVAALAHQAQGVNGTALVVCIRRSTVLEQLTLRQHMAQRLDSAVMQHIGDDWTAKMSIHSTLFSSEIPLLPPPQQPWPQPWLSGPGYSVCCWGCLGDGWKLL